MITKEQAVELKHGEILHSEWTNFDGTCERWRVNGKPKTWKRDVKRFSIPIKYGLRGFWALTQDTAMLLHIPGEEGRRCFQVKKKN